jgi:hypothetical protein
LPANGTGDYILCGLDCHVVLNKEVRRLGVIECIYHGWMIGAAEDGNRIEYNPKK